MKIDLPSGAWADLLTPDKMRAKHYRTAMRAISSMGKQRPGAQAIDMTDGAIAIMVQDWNVTVERKDERSGQVTVEALPVPSEDFEALDELEYEDYDTLLNHPFVRQIVQRINEVRGERVSPDDYDDPASPSEPSSESGLAPRATASPRTGTSTPSGTTKRSTSGSRSGGAGRRSK